MLDTERYCLILPHYNTPPHEVAGYLFLYYLLFSVYVHASQIVCKKEESHQIAKVRRLI